MQFYEITEDLKASPGEYIFHTPTNQIVLCGSFNREKNQIKVLAHGRLVVDKIQNFKKIRINQSEQRERQKHRKTNCMKCGK